MSLGSFNSLISICRWNGWVENDTAWASGSPVLESQCSHYTCLEVTWRKWSPPLLLLQDLSERMQVKCRAQCTAYIVFSKDIFVNIWHLLFLKLILTRPILAMWQRQMMDVDWVPVHSTYFPDSLAARLDSRNLFWLIGSEWECHVTTVCWQI